MKNINILIVDDSPSFVLYLRELFYKNGYKNIFSAYDKDSTLNLLNEKFIHVVILDIELISIQEGFELGRIIHDNYNIPVVYITAKEEEKIKTLLKDEYRFYGLLFKPFLFSELEALIKNAYIATQERYIQEGSLKRLLDYVLFPSAIFFKDELILFNDEFNNFCKNVLKININKKFKLANVLPDLLPVIKDHLYSSQSTAKYEGTIEIQNKKIDVEIIALSSNYYQIIVKISNLEIVSQRGLYPFEKFNFLLNLLDRLFDGIVILNEKREILYTNSTFLRLFDFEENEVLNQNIKIIKNVHIKKRYYVKIWRELEKNFIWEGKIYSSKKNGEERTDWFSINKIYDSSTKITFYIVVITELDRRIQQEERLFYLAHYDELTNLPNRRFFKETIKKEILVSIRNKTKFALIFIDLDKFKSINDEYGHLIGDQVLIYFAGILKNILRKSDFIARYAGDEFCIIINQIQNQSVLITILEKILSLTKKEFVFNDIKIPISISIGVSIFPDDLNDIPIDKTNHEELINRLIHNADSKMYDAKKHGGNRFYFFNQELHHYNLIREQFLDQKELNNIEILFQFIYRKYDHSIVAIQPIFCLNSIEKNKEFCLYTKLFIEANLEREEFIFNKIYSYLEQINDLILNQNIYLYFRFSLQFLINKKDYIQKLTNLNSKIILELSEKEILNLLEFHESFLDELNHFKIQFSILVDSDTSVFSVKQFKKINIFCITPDMSKLFKTINQDMKYDLDLLLNHIRTLRFPIMLHNINNKEDLKFIEDYNINYYKGDLLNYSVEEIKNILQSNTLKK